MTRFRIGWHSGSGRRVVRRAGGRRTLGRMRSARGRVPVQDDKFIWFFRIAEGVSGNAAFQRGFAHVGDVDDRLAVIGDAFSDANSRTRFYRPCSQYKNWSSLIFYLIG